jgi:hypothetical protein
MDPFGQRREREVEFGDDAVGAVGVVHLLDVRPVQLDDPRRLLDRDDADAGDVAAVAQHAVAERADAAGPAGDEAADGGEAAGRGPHVQHLAGFGDGLVEGLDAHAGLHADRSRSDIEHPVEAGDVEHDAALHRHALAVVAGAAAAHGQRHAVAGAGGGDADHLVLGFGDDDEIAGQAFELFGEDRRVPEIVAGLERDVFRVVVDADAVDVAAQGGEGGFGRSHAVSRIGSGWTESGRPARQTVQAARASVTRPAGEGAAT